MAIQSILSLPIYHDFLKEYQFNLEGFLFDLCGLTLTRDQQVLSQLAINPTSRISVVSGTGTGKTAWLGGAALHSMWCFPVVEYDGKIEVGSNTYVGAPVIQQVADGVWKEMNDNFQRIKMLDGMGWLTGRTHPKAERWYMDGYKDQWFIAKIALGNADSVAIAGKHRYYQTIFIDEAAGVADSHYDVINGTQTQEGNRTFLFSQGVKTTGYFYDTHHTLSHINTPVDEGGWINLCFNSENAPHVSRKWLKAREVESGGRDSVEYRIRVLGQFAEDEERTLIHRRMLDEAMANTTPLIAEDDEDWGWFLLCDVAAGEYRDYSVATLAKVKGVGENRLIDFIDIPIFSNGIDVKQFKGRIAEEAAKYSNIRLIIDSGGNGLQLCKDLEDEGFDVVRVSWGKPNFKTEYKNRFINQRAQCSVHTRDAIRQGRIRFLWNLPKKTKEMFIYQATHIPYNFTDSGVLRYQIMGKEKMAAQGIKSPDIFDTVCFANLEGVHYNVSDRADGGVGAQEKKKSALELAKAKMAAITIK
ncbi:hypothetical protein [Vitreoscilla stercoraria]|uniref:Terminase n=1 Tax=Vitreoscilla stercoraria TaxID=61 RepID=A0ABY4EF89_VITST|nr:hypothetical protein [Vitreoscilla stercoraria]UOO93378.1 hypothetical protein LVJ81_04945 [Vitreoscilla stercoraria]